MKNVEDILVKRTFDVIRLYRLRARYIAVQEKVRLSWCIFCENSRHLVTVILQSNELTGSLDSGHHH